MEQVFHQGKRRTPMPLRREQSCGACVFLAPTANELPMLRKTEKNCTERPVRASELDFVG